MKYIFSKAFSMTFNDSQLGYIATNFMVMEENDVVEYAYGSFINRANEVETYEIRADYSDDGTVEIYSLNTPKGAELISVDKLFSCLEGAKPRETIQLNLDK